MDSLVESTTHALDKIKLRAQEAAHDVAAPQRHVLVDLTVQFIGAEGLPKMDVVGTADPYLVATIDDKIKFTSTVQAGTLTPVWNELWRVKNVPSDGTMKIVVFDKDDGSPVDDRIGTCEFDLTEGAKEGKLTGGLRRNRGTLWAKITVLPATSPHLLPYTFDGPISYSRHSSPTVGLLTNLDENGRRLYSTWKMRIRGVRSYLGGPPQHWNTEYAAAQRIFGTGPASLAIRTSIQTGHRMLYARSTRNGFGVIEKAEDVFALLTGGRVAPHRVKPAVYTYVISQDDDTFRFSETGAAFFVDFASKHALHANCAEAVRYSGEFHPRPAGGWDLFSDDKTDKEVQWELVIDNNSGTYAPDKGLLPKLQALFDYNFPGFVILALDRSDPELEKSREACRAYALKHRAVGKSELQPNKQAEGEETLCHRISVSNDLPPKKRLPSETTAETEDDPGMPYFLEPA